MGWSRMKKLLSILVLLSISAFAEKVRYDNFKVFSVNIEEESHLQVLRDFQNEQGVTFWEPPVKVNTKVNVAIPPQQLENFKEIMGTAKINFNLKIENVQDLIDKENPTRSGKAEGDFDWTSYHSLEEIYAWIDEIAAQFPDQVTVTDIGDTYEGRKMKIVKISFQEGNRGIFIETNIHAREWISSATVTYLINELLTSTDPDIMDIARNVDWYILPLANPDGFKYSHEHDRMWRSTRSKDHSVICHGADGNRNYDYNWMEGGASQVKCSYTYAGPAANSEIETRNEDAFFYSHAAQLDVFLAFHSYSQLLLIPYGNGVKAPNYDEQFAVAQAAAERLFSVHGTTYTVGNSQEVLYTTSGTSRDHARGRHNIPFSFTYEMRDTGDFGFLLPADQIIPNADEIVQSLVGLVVRARDFGYFAIPPQK